MPVPYNYVTMRAGGMWYVVHPPLLLWYAIQFPLRTVDASLMHPPNDPFAYHAPLCSQHVRRVHTMVQCREPRPYVALAGAPRIVILGAGRETRADDVVEVGALL